MGKAFPSRRLRGPLPLRAGRFPRNAPHYSTCLSSLDLRSSSRRHLPRRISDRCQHTAGFAFQASLAAFTHARESHPHLQRPVWHRLLRRPNGRPAVAPASLGASPATEARPAPPRLSTRTGPCSVTGHAGHGFGKKLRLTEVTGFTLSTGRCDTPGHLHGRMRAWKKSCANQRA